MRRVYCGPGCEGMGRTEDRFNIDRVLGYFDAVQMELGPAIGVQVLAMTFDLGSELIHGLLRREDQDVVDAGIILDLAGEKETRLIKLVGAFVYFFKARDLVEPGPVQCVSASNDIKALERGPLGKVLHGHVLTDTYGEPAVDVEVSVELHGWGIDLMI
jgi:hypothetical protein